MEVERAPAHVHHAGTDLVSNERHREAILAAVRLGASPQTAMVKMGYTNTLKHWRYANAHGTWTGGGPILPETLAMIRAFLEQLEQAIAEGEQHLIEIVADAAGKVNEKTGLVDWQPAKFLLTHGPARSNWYPHQEPTEVTVTGVRASPEYREAKNLTDAELIDGIEDPTWAALLKPANGASE